MSGSFTNRLQLLTDYLLRRPQSSGKPIDLTIETTTKCNLRCPMCLREDLIPAIKDMDLALFKKVIDQGQRYIEVVAGMYLGEPLLNPQIFEMVKYCKGKGLRVLLSTNATTLNRQTTEALLSTGLDYLILSFDGGTKQTYEQYRLGAEFDKVKNNIVNFLKLKQAAHAKTHCTIQMVILKDSASEIEEFTKLWKDVEGIDDLRYKPNMVLNGDFAIPRPLDNPAVLKKPCFHLWRSNLVVRYDGVAFPCCWSYGALPIGDLRSQSLEEVWNSPAMVGLRKKHIEGRADEISACRNCSMSQPSPLAVWSAFLLNAYLIRKALPLKDRITYMRARIGDCFKKVRSWWQRPYNASVN